MIQMLQLVGNGLGLILVQKGGCTSIKQALYAAGRLAPGVTADAFLAETDRRVLFMRGPHDRAESAFRMFRGESG